MLDCSVNVSGWCIAEKEGAGYFVSNEGELCREFQKARGVLANFL